MVFQHVFCNNSKKTPFSPPWLDQLLEELDLTRPSLITQNYRLNPQTRYHPELESLVVQHFHFAAIASHCTSQHQSAAWFPSRNLVLNRILLYQSINVVWLQGESWWRRLFDRRDSLLRGICWPSSRAEPGWAIFIRSC